MNSLIRVSCVSNRVCPAQPDRCLTFALAGIDAVRESAPDLIVLPSFALTSSGGGSLSSNRALLDAANTALDELCLATADLPAYVVAGLLVDDWGKPAPVCAVLYQGQVLGLLPSHSVAGLRFDGAYSDRVLPWDTIFGLGGCRFTVCSCPPEQLVLKAAELQRTGCDLIVCPCCLPITAGYVSEARRALRLVSKTLGCAIALCDGGTGDTTSPVLTSGFAGFYECGEEMRFILHKNGDYAGPADSITADLDTDVIAALKNGGAYVKPYAHREVESEKRGILRRIPQNPFLNCPNRDAYVGELFSLQVAALMGRIQNSGLSRVVLGVSGGLDSTLALLVAARAMDCLGMPRKNILGVTMPGFGTTGRTYQNAAALMEQLDCECAEIPIKAACTQHFSDIGHDPDTHDVTYENAQARERTQILFDLANRSGGFVLGTGDLSEAALGWCTFGGDHLSGYSINACLTKNMVRAVVKYVADNGLAALPAREPDAETALPAAAANLKKPKNTLPPLSMTGEVPVQRQRGEAAVLHDILATPVSPELLPPAAGQMTQKTEEILGGYELHDFFTYYLVRYAFRPEKLFRYACVAFGAQLEPTAIKERLLLFLRRFFGAQFKRSCAPDAASITEVNLLAPDFTMPSDANPRVLLEEAEAITVSSCSLK